MGEPMTSDAYACTTAAGNHPYEDDIYDEFGLHLLDGVDLLETSHCNHGDENTGLEGYGRLYTTFNLSGTVWNTGVFSHWDVEGRMWVPGALLLR